MNTSLNFFNKLHKSEKRIQKSFQKYERIDKYTILLLPLTRIVTALVLVHPSITIILSLVVPKAISLTCPYKK